ncbi:MAG: DNA-3-methyladenine glycosylase 2 family protein [Anaerolineae bacterium]|nr:DNA-3-methyladenine glycosylase 2 family protein [Anaerolineae bacterium]
MPEFLTEETLRSCVLALAKAEPVFKHILETLGAPPLWARPPGFSTLVHIILEQQVSLASARAAFEKLKQACPSLTPEQFLSLDDGALKAIGFSRQKAATCRNLAQRILEGGLELDALAGQSDEQVRAVLTGLKGIGPWTAEIYLLMALGRPDAWPHSDLALAAAARRTFALPEIPKPPELERLGERWRPYRAAAARLLWHYYLNVEKGTGSYVA